MKNEPKQKNITCEYCNKIYDEVDSNASTAFMYCCKECETRDENELQTVIEEVRRMKNENKRV